MTRWTIPNARGEARRWLDEWIRLLEGPVSQLLSRITGDGDIRILGSQAVLGTLDGPDLPEEATLSMEADIGFADDPDTSKADQVDGAIGELSAFHQMYGYYGQGVSLSTAVLPAGWRDRARHLDDEDARPGYPRCLEVHDLVELDASVAERARSAGQEPRRSERPVRRKARAARR